MELFGYKILKKESLDNTFFNRENFLNYFYTKDQKLTICDIGANTGQTIDYFLNYFKNSIIHAFEPGIVAFEELEKKYRISDQIIINNKAVGQESGFLYLNCYSYSAYNSFFEINPNSFIVKGAIYKKTELCKDELNEPKKQRAEIITLDRYVEENKIEKLDIVKIDVQGFEENVLLGAMNLIKKQLISLIIVEITFDDYYTHSTSFIDVERILLQNNYMFWDVSHIYKDLKRGRTCWIDAVYVSRELFEKRARDEEK